MSTFKRWKWSRTEIVFMVVVAIICVWFALFRIYLSMTTLLICGDRIPKSDFTSVFITVSNHMYEVDDHALVTELAESVSHFPKNGHIQLTSAGQPITPGPVLKPLSFFVLTTHPSRNRSSTYEGFMYSSNHGILWLGGTQGYYWLVPQGFVNQLETVIRLRQARRVS